MRARTTIAAAIMAAALASNASALPQVQDKPQAAAQYWDMCKAETVVFATMQLCATFDRWQSPSFDDSPQRGKRKRKPILRMDYESDCLYLAMEFCIPL